MSTYYDINNLLELDHNKAVAAKRLEGIMRRITSNKRLAEEKVAVTLLAI